MRFLPMWTVSDADPKGDCKRGRRVGVVTLGERCLYVRKFGKAHYIPYFALSRFFRRVQGVPVKLGCCNGEVRVENLVLCVTENGEERELAQIQLPGERAAKAVMEDLKRLAPNAAYGYVPKEREA